LKNLDGLSCINFLGNTNSHNSFFRKAAMLLQTKAIVHDDGFSYVSVMLKESEEQVAQQIGRNIAGRFQFQEIGIFGSTHNGFEFAEEAGLQGVEFLEIIRRV
jgi:hypothetical protein